MKFFWQKNKPEKEQKLKESKPAEKLILTSEKVELTPDEFYRKKLKKYEYYSASNKKLKALATGFLEIIGENFDEFKLKYDSDEDEDEV